MNALERFAEQQHRAQARVNLAIWGPVVLPQWSRLFFTLSDTQLNALPPIDLQLTPTPAD